MCWLSSVCECGTAPRALATALALLLPLAGCDALPEQSAPEASLPVLRTPIGPAPGPEPPEAPSMNPYASDPMALQEGRTLFARYNCVGCHGDHGGGGMGPSLRDASWSYGSSDGNLFSSIAEGRSQGMPAWGTKIPTLQIWKLVTYLRSLRTDHEPDAPDQSIPPPPAEP